MSRNIPKGDDRSRSIRRRHDLENRYDRLRGAILRKAWGIREDQYKRDLDGPDFPPVVEDDAREFIEYLDVAGADWVDFGDETPGTLAYASVDYALRIIRDSKGEYGI